MFPASHIRTRTDTSANFTSVNPTLLKGEMAWESDTHKIKIGDGQHSYTSLPYELTDIVTDTAANWDQSSVVYMAGRLLVDITYNVCKLADGVHTWANLPMFQGEVGGGDANNDFVPGLVVSSNP